MRLKRGFKLNNNDKINILKESITQYYNNELGLKENLDIKAAKKIYDEYDELNSWLEQLRYILDLDKDVVVLKNA
jgi:hypothetical protein